MSIEEIGAFEAKTRLSELLERVSRGQVYRITKRGKPIAELRPIEGAAGRPRPRPRGHRRGLRCSTRGDAGLHEVKLLLDTHAFLWFVTGDRRLGRGARRALEQDDAQLHLSAATIWEMAIKSSLGRLTLPGPLDRYVAEKLVPSILPSISR